MKILKKCLTLLLALSLSLPIAMMAACGDDDKDDKPNTEQNGGNNGNEDDPNAVKEFTYDTKNPDPAGSEYNRYEGEEGEYVIQLTAGKTHYYSFSVKSAGQYALETLEVNDNVSIARHSANESYLSPVGTPATEQEDGTLISKVTCTQVYFNSSWRATYAVTAEASGTLRIRFYRLGDAPPDPKYIVTKVVAEEIVGRAPEGPAEEEAVQVPWLVKDNPTYFYDEDYEMTFIDLVTGEEKTARGFYRYGYKTDLNAPVIWAAITSSSERYLENTSFSALESPGINLTIQTGTRPSTHPDVQDILQNNYVDFIMNNGGIIDSITEKPVEGDATKLCYMNVTNSDGLYPVNQELFEFLNYYTQKNPPFIDDGVNIARENYWLAPCYYYQSVVSGTQNKPIVLQTGAPTFLSANMKNTYYKIESETAKQVTLEGSEGLIIYVNGMNYGVEGNGFSLTLDIPEGGITFILKARYEANYTITATVVGE